MFLFNKSFSKLLSGLSQIIHIDLWLNVYTTYLYFILIAAEYLEPSLEQTNVGQLS